MSILKKDIEEFDALTAENFSFLAEDFSFRFAGTTTVDDDPRDACVVAKYRKDDFRVDIAWNPFAMSLGVLIRVNNEELGRREKSVYLEPFVEFASGGATLPVVPQIYPGMSLGQIRKAMKGRESLFKSGIAAALRDVAERLRTHLASVQDASPETIRKYQTWYQSRGKVA